MALPSHAICYSISSKWLSPRWFCSLPWLLAAHMCVCAVVSTSSRQYRIATVFVFMQRTSAYTERRRRRREISIDCAYPQLFFVAVYVKIRAFASASVRTRVSHSSSSKIVIRVREGENDEYNRPESEEMTILPVFFLPFFSLLFLASNSSIVLFLSILSVGWVTLVYLVKRQRERKMSVLLVPFFSFRCILSMIRANEEWILL